MEILDLKKINELLTEADIKASEEVLNEKQVEEIKKRIDLNPAEEFGIGKCLPNAHCVSKITGAIIVEGVAYVVVQKGEVNSEAIIKHAWNIINGEHFDVTKDFVWPNLNMSLVKSEYHFIDMFTSEDYIISNGIIEFKSNSGQIASSLKYLYTKNNVVTSLYALGLEPELQERLIKECLTIIKEE